jgi:chloramphenicol-sensitive protein RarD
MSDPVKGVVAMLAACTIWGLSAIYYKLLVHVPPLEVLAHRTLWSCVFFAAILGFQGRLGMIRAALSGPRDLALLAFAALMISANWLCFISSVQWGRAMEASLGYYMFPLVSVLFGALFFREMLGRVQLTAVALAGLAVTILTIGLGAAPWMALLIACTFGLYGVAKKMLTVGPVVSVTAEVLLLAPVALGILYYVHSTGDGHFTENTRDALLLAGSGPLTATPLILFSYAAKRVRFGTVGLVQYLNPTLQFLVATFIFQEFFSPWHAIALPLIWVALALYTGVSLRQERAARKSRIKV